MRFEEKKYYTTYSSHYFQADLNIVLCERSMFCRREKRTLFPPSQYEYMARVHNIIYIKQNDIRISWDYLLYLYRLYAVFFSN